MSVDLKELLKCAPKLDRAVEAEPDGSVIRLTGPLDGESTAAVTVLSENYLAEIGALLGLGDTMAWAVNGERSCHYVVHGEQSFAVVVGAPTKSPARVLERLCDVWK